MVPYAVKTYLPILESVRTGVLSDRAILCQVLDDRRFVEACVILLRNCVEVPNLRVPKEIETKLKKEKSKVKLLLDRKQSLANKRRALTVKLVKLIAQIRAWGRLPWSRTRTTLSWLVCLLIVYQMQIPNCREEKWHGSGRRRRKRCRQRRATKSRRRAKRGRQSDKWQSRRWSGMRGEKQWWQWRRTRFEFLNFYKFFIDYLQTPPW